jgi:hypothetical protein
MTRGLLSLPIVRGESVPGAGLSSHPSHEQARRELTEASRSACVHAQGSGIELETQVAQLLTLERGLVVRERDFLRWDDALRAAALDPAAFKLPA